MKRVMVLLGPPVAVLLLHAVAWRVMAELDVVRALLSPGLHSQLAHLLLGVCFLLLRIAALVAVPGWLAAAAVVAVKS